MSGRVIPGAKGLILGRIRDALGSRPPAPGEYAQISRDYRQAATVDREACVALFLDRLAHYQVGVFRCEAGALSRTVAEALAGRGRQAIVVPRAVPREWLPDTLRAVDGDAASHGELDASEGVLTGCSAAIASTGTIVLTHAGADGRRALTLVPDYHLCVVFAEQIVETVPEGIRRVAALTPELVTTISGPSATADIEMTRIKGVHGPRTVDVVVVG